MPITECLRLSSAMVMLLAHIANIISMIGLDSHAQFSASQNFLDHESPFAAGFKNHLEGPDRAGSVVIWLLICICIRSMAEMSLGELGRACGHAGEH